MAWYNSAKDLKKAVQPVAKAAGDVYSAAIKQPTAATYQSVKTGSLKPITQNAGNTWGSIKAGGKKIGQGIGVIPQDKAANAGSNMPAMSEAATYANNKLMLSGVGGDQITQDFGGMIGGAEKPDEARAAIAQQYAQMGSLAKMREGAQRQTEQSAIQRRLAASGMGGSGAGMRLAGLAEQQAGRRSAETQLGLGAERASREQSAMDAISGRNLQREGMRVGAAESAAQRQFNVQQATRQGELQTAQFEMDKATTLENQKIAREMQRYNNSGLIGQLGQDLFGSFGKKTSMKTPLAGLGI
jgi:hypothetical protein